MIDENRIYITQLKISDVPWHRLTTAYGRATEFPRYFAVMEHMDDSLAAEQVLSELAENIEHQSTLWHATPFAMVFLCRILKKALAESTANPVAHDLAEQIMNICREILECVKDTDEMEHDNPLPSFSDLLKEKYLWSEEYDKEEDGLRWEEDEVFPDDLFYSFYFYSREVMQAYKYILEQAPKEFTEQAAAVLKLL